MRERKKKENWVGKDLYWYNYKCIGERNMYLYLYKDSLSLYTNTIYTFLFLSSERDEGEN